MHINNHLLASLTGILLVMSASAADTGLTPPALTLSDSYGDSVTIDSTGTVTCAGSGTICMPATASDGSITWSGTLGIFNISVAGGQSKPALPSARINLNLRVTTGAFGAGGATSATLNAKWSDVGFSGAGPVVMTATSSLSGSVSVVYTGYVDSANALFGAGTTVGPIGAITSRSSKTVTGPGPASAPFSMTEAVQATMGPNSSFTLSSLSMMASPAPALILGCPTASGQVGVPYSSNLVAAGGFPPYSFSMSGSLPPGLTLDPSTGEIDGTPNTPGTYSFTPEVIDSSGNPEQSTVQSQCSIAITTPPGPPALACPTPNDDEGARYSSSLVATGGTPPYTFSISSGALPPGLSLNPAGGAITGIDTTATGSFPFTARVVGSSANAAAAMSNCLVVAQAAKPDVVPCQPAMTGCPKYATTPQTVQVKTQFATLVAKVIGVFPLEGQKVVFKIVKTGLATATFPPNANLTADTDKDGFVKAPPLTANDKTGKYSVFATLQGTNLAPAPRVQFELINAAGPALNISATSGSGQKTTVGSRFKNSLVATVTDQLGNAVPNVPVTFVAPGAGASADFGLPAMILAAEWTVNTDSKGQAESPIPLANAIAGPYDIVAKFAPDKGVVNPVSSINFAMTNTPGPPAILEPILPKGGYGPTVGTKFGPLVAHLTDEFGNKLNGWSVLFQSVNIGRPGAKFDKGDSIGTKFTIATDTNGDAKSSTLTANGMAGTYKISATVVEAVKGKLQPVKFKGQDVSAEFPIENK